jgi:hypothetical protein
MKNILYIALVTFVLMSCSDFLDVKPAGRLIPEAGDVVAYDRLLNNPSTVVGIFQNNNGTSALNFLGDDLKISDIQAEFGWHNGHPNMDCYFAYIFQMPYADPNLQDHYWNIGIFRPATIFNIVIEGANKVRTRETDRLADQVIAQATVARAHLYFYGALGYGPVFRPGGDNSRRVLPFRTADDVMAPMEDLSTMQELFDRILADIHSVMPDIPEMVPSNTRFGRVQTYAFLAHYHLFTRNFDSVVYYADNALTLASMQRGGMRNLFFDMNLFSWSNPQVATNPDLRAADVIVTPESGEALTVSWHRENLLFRSSATAQGNVLSYPSTDFLALFDANTDLRREFFFFEHDGFRVVAGNEFHDDGRKVLNFQDKLNRTSGYTFPEVLLMRAEGLARTGRLPEALADLNYLRQFRHRTGTPELNILAQNDLIHEIINERRRELPVGSPKRFFDLKRFVLDEGMPWSVPTITRTLRGRTHTANVDSEYFILPISNDVLRWNPQWGIPLESRPWSPNR